MESGGEWWANSPGAWNYFAVRISPSGRVRLSIYEGAEKLREEGPQCGFAPSRQSWSDRPVIPGHIRSDQDAIREALAAKWANRHRAMIVDALAHELDQIGDARGG